MRRCWEAEEVSRVSQEQQGQGLGLRHLGSNQSTQPTGAWHSSLHGVGQRLYGMDTSHSRDGTSSNSSSSLSLLTVHTQLRAWG